MHRPLLLPTAALASTLALGCADHQSPTAPADSPAPSLSVERGTVPFAFAFSDVGHTLFIGLSIEDLTSLFCTGTEFDVDLLNQLTVTRPDDSIKLLLRGKDVNVVVVEFVNCDNLIDLSLTGTARVLYTDSDAFVTGKRADASQIQVTGTVTDASGQQYHLTAVDVRVIAPGSTAENPVDLNSVIKIKLTPIGG